MKVVFCRPELTMEGTKEAEVFLNECSIILARYVLDLKYIDSCMLLQQTMPENAARDDILIFFTSEKGTYDERISGLIQTYVNAQSRVWAIAMEADPKCRQLPEPLSERQIFDVSLRKDSRNPLNHNMKAIAHIFARKIIAQTCSPLYRDEVLYFISYRWTDGEELAKKLADGLKLLTRERNVHRDAVNVAAGGSAREEIDEHLKVSDVLIFLQTEEAQNSIYIMEKLSYALLNDIPVLWIQMDNASCEDMEVWPGKGPVLRYKSKEFSDPDRMAEIADEIEEKCFQLIMYSSGQLTSYIDCLMEMDHEGKIKLQRDEARILAYQVEYREKAGAAYGTGIRKHYIQCFGRNPREQDMADFCEAAKNMGLYEKNDQLFLLSNHGKRESHKGDIKICEENFEDYLTELQNVSGIQRQKPGKRIILSCAFPECDEIYHNSLMQAVVIYSKQIIRSGYTLVFGGHHAFQNLIFEVGNLYSSDAEYPIEMHMERSRAGRYNVYALREKCNLILADGERKMRENMICRGKAELLICIGGKMKEERFMQGVEHEVALAKRKGIPVALVGTAGGRSSAYAFEVLQKGAWNDLNPWGRELNEELFYNINHRLMAERLLNAVRGKA